MTKKLVGPAGLLLAFLCFGLPFLTVSCSSPVGEISASYTGFTFAFGGRPEVTTSLSDLPPDRQSDTAISWQPLALGAVLLIVSGLVVGLALPRLRARVSLLSALSSALLVVVNQFVVRDEIVRDATREDLVPATVVEDMIESRVGFWLTLALLLGVAAHGTLEIVRRRMGAPDTPARPPFPDPGRL